MFQKTLDDKKENRESSSSDSNSVNPRIVNDIPLIGEKPIEAEPDFGRPFRARPAREPKAIVRFDQPYRAENEPIRLSLHTNPPFATKNKGFFPGPAVNRSSKSFPLHPSAINLLASNAQKPANSLHFDRTTTQKPILHHHHHHYDDYYSDYDEDTHPDYSADYPINDKVEPLNLSNRDKVAPQANRELLDVYQRPSRVLYADSSRPGNNRNPKFVSKSDLRFPAQYSNNRNYNK
jgi:hypothetical protein